jgi:hypothetical protein
MAEKKKLTKEAIAEVIEADETNVPDDVRKFMQIFKDFVDCTEGMEFPDGLKPTSEDLQKMATSVYIERNKGQRAARFAEPEPVFETADSTTVRTMEPKAAARKGDLPGSLTCPECGEEIELRHGANSGKPYYRCKNAADHKSGTDVWLNLDKKTGKVRASPVKN